MKPAIPSLAYRRRLARVYAEAAKCLGLWDLSLSCCVSIINALPARHTQDSRLCRDASAFFKFIFAYDRSPYAPKDYRRRFGYWWGRRRYTERVMALELAARMVTDSKNWQWYFQMSP